MCRLAKQVKQVKFVKFTRDVFFYVCRLVDLMKTATVNANTLYLFGKIELLSIHAT